MSPRGGRWRIRARYIVIACAFLILAPLTLVHGVLRASLPRLDGELARLGIVAPVTIERDSRGVPTIEAANRVDLAYGTGFVHGQDRFFEMDLSRRLPAGELSELFGELALSQDEKARLFRFRQVARAALQQGSPEQRAVLEAYARGVNAGLQSLRSRPWEYWLLGSLPAQWRPEDTILVTFAMWWDLQYTGLQREIVRMQVNARLGGPECVAGWKCGLQFLYPSRTAWDAPNAPGDVLNPGGAAVAAGAIPAAEAIPPPEVLNVRGPSREASAAGNASAAPTPRSVSAARLANPKSARRADVGSNNWAVSGRRTATGAALIANDMHLTARVPPVWYRARLRVAGNATQPALDLNGVTLPGAPLLVAGSNGRIAWGFTNSYGDWIHITFVPCTSVGDDSLQTSAGSLPLAVVQEEIRIKGRPAVAFPVKSSPDGVLFAAHPEKQSCWFVTWLAQQAGATNMNLMGLERAGSVRDALALAPGIGIPHQNLVVGDRDGHVAWTIAGRIPSDTGPNRAKGQSAWTPAENHPRIVDPEAGFLWTANARATDDAGQEAAIGGEDTSVGADYDLGARAHQIRDDLLALNGPATPADMLAIQLDDKAVYLTRWRTMLLSLLDEPAIQGHPLRAQFRRSVEGWNARATVDSTGYRLVRAYRDRTEEAVWEMMLRVFDIAPGEDATVPGQFEPALWRLVHDQPLHMLAPDYGSWREFLLVQVDGAIAELLESCGDLPHCTWGSRKPVRIRHPLSRSLPFLARLLDMPTVELPGDHDMPRVQDGPIGASERFAVSPGHEEQGYMHIPGGQSGHPLSPYYRAGFDDWAQGVNAPFLPGPAQHRLTLRPD